MSGRADFIGSIFRKVFGQNFPKVEDAFGIRSASFEKGLSQAFFSKKNRRGILYWSAAAFLFPKNQAG